MEEKKPHLILKHSKEIRLIYKLSNVICPGTVGIGKERGGRKKGKKSAVNQVTMQLCAD